MAKIVKNELHRELLSSSALNPWYAHTSSPRGAMFTGNLGQFLAVTGATKRFQQAGVEREFAKTTFKLAFQCDAEVIRSIPRYPKMVGPDVIRDNPQTVVVYENFHTKEVDILNLVRYHSSHQHFGFRFKYDQDVLDSIQPGETFRAGTKVAGSPLVDEDGDYMYGLETNVAFMSDVATIEDGIKVSDAYLDRIIPTSYEKRIINFGNSRFPINLYGNPNKYQPFPDIGDRIQSDGLLAALREHDDLLNVVNMTPSALCDCDYIYDYKHYAEPDAKVVDIKVSRNVNLNIPPMPVGMEHQLLKYYEADNAFYRKIVDTYIEQFRKRGNNLKITPAFQRLMVEAIHRVGQEYHSRGMWPKGLRFDAFKVDENYRNVPLDAWRIEITYERQNKPNVGFKITDTHGGKGVICRVVPEEDMPIDENGNRVEVIMDDLSTTRRLNPGRFYEQYVNACSRDVANRVREAFQLSTDPKTPPTKNEAYNAILASPPDFVVRQLEYVLSYYAEVSPKMQEVMGRLMDRDANAGVEHLVSIMAKGIYLYVPADNPIDRPEMIRQLSQNFPARKTPVTFRALDGRMVKTVKPVLIGSMYFMVLEKTAEDWSAVSSAKLQHYGTTARLTNQDKNSAPGRQQVTKTIGEAEDRLLAATIGGENVADIMDAHNNPRAHKAMQRAILTAEHPTNIDEVLNREEIPKGGHRPLSYVRHLFECAGRTFSNE